MNTSEYVAAVRHRLGLRDDDPILTDTQILEDLNFALQAIASKRDWPWLYAEEDGTATHGTDYGLPGSYSKTVFITVNGIELTSAGIADLARFRSQYGSPTHFSISGDFFKFAPSVPENTEYDVIHGFYQNEPALITDLDAPLLPDQFSEWLVLETAIRSSSRTNRTDRVALWRDEASVWEKNAKEQVRRSSNPPTIKRTRPSIWQDVY